MSQQKLQMKYHPAKKEVEFKRIGADGKESPINKNSVLHDYTGKKKGEFVLQDHGNAFFEDIAKAFDGEQSVEIEVVTTQKDFEDFKAMVEHYNKEPNKKVTISTMLCEELPDMNETYRVVAEHGKKAIAILGKHRSTFSDVPQEHPAVKGSIERFSTIIQTEVDNIYEKIESLKDSRVNLCFAGAYSVGKSALINAILGYQILPKAIKSTTARMFTIQSPKTGEYVRIVFDIQDKNSNQHANLQWNVKSKTFEFIAGPSENKTRESIQETINKHQSEPQHRQIYEISTTLNSIEDVATNIKVFFPIPLDNDQTQFTIYDTPGTDSNFGEHQEVLQKALFEQTHSILIFVAAPNKLEGEGNSALLSYLKAAEENQSRTTIDIGRSLFVINFADSTSADERRELQSEKIVHKKSNPLDDDDFSISLSDKKLFFTSAKVAYAAKAKKNGIADNKQERIIKHHAGSINDREDGCYYKQNRVATSEYAKLKQIAHCDDELEKAEKEQDDLDVLYICSGLFTLEKEIKEYGEKFAAAVRAFAIINSVEKALSTLNRQAEMLEGNVQENIVQIEKEIEELRTTITDGFREVRRKYDIKEGQQLPDRLRTELNLDAESLHDKITESTSSGIGGMLHRCWKKCWVYLSPNAEHKKEIIHTLTSALSDFTADFLKKRQRELENARDRFLADVKDVIRKNGAISDEAKRFFLDIPAATVRPPAVPEEFGDIYDNNKRSGSFLILWNTYVDIEGVKKDSAKALENLARKMCNEFAEDYRKALDDILRKAETVFEGNLAEYSLTMQAKLHGKEAMEQFRAKIVAAADDVKSCQDELNTKIWNAKKDGETR